MSNTLQQQLKRAMAIVDRYRQRGNKLPRELNKARRVDPEKLQGELVIVLIYGKHHIHVYVVLLIFRVS